MRSYSFQLLEAIDEQLDLVREAGCKLQISHLQTVGRANWDKQERALARLEQAREEGIDVEFDSYPYLAGSTVLTQLLPQSALDGGIPAMLGRLDDPASRKDIAKDTIDQMAQQWSDIFISSVGSAEGQRFVGKHFEDIAEMLGVEPIEAVFRLLEAEKGIANMLSFNQSDANLRKLLAHPLCTVITDGFYVKGRPHPRLYGTFPCLLGEMVRERKWLGLAEAIHKITGKPAARYGMTDRGSLRSGAYADVVVFDAATIQARATYEDPCQSPLGVKHVFREGKEILPSA
jgi:N-acyl-D-amino-acid deacylase